MTENYDTSWDLIESDEGKPVISKHAKEKNQICFLQIRITCLLRRMTAMSFTRMGYLYSISPK